MDKMDNMNLKDKGVYKKEEVIFYKGFTNIETVLKKGKKEGLVYTRKGLATEIYDIPAKEFEGRRNRMSHRADIAYQRVGELLMNLVKKGLVIEHKETLIRSYVYEWK